MSKPRVLLLSNWFSPGYKGGGSQAAATNLVQALEDEFNFLVITRDRDPGETEPFPDISAGKWNDRDNARVRYLNPAELNLTTINAILRETPHDLIHLNSVVSLPFAAYPLVARQFKAASASPLLISPHGEMAPQALMKKGFRKRFYIGGSKALGMFGDAHWHAATSHEEKDIRRVWGANARVSVAPILPPQHFCTVGETERPAKNAGKLNAVFLARIDRMKNLDLAIDVMASIPNTTLDIFGPIGQPDYWAECQKRIAASGRATSFRYRGAIPPSDVMPTLSRYDVLFLPSQSESFGYAILEALAAACPVLISDRTPWRELEHAGAGYDLPIGDPARFRTALLSLRDMDVATHGALRQRARSYAIAYLKNSPAKDATRKMYMAVLGGR